MRGASLKVLYRDLADSCERATDVLEKFEGAPWDNPAASTKAEEEDDLFKYRPDQARDDHGRFTDEGGGVYGERKPPKGGGKKPKGKQLSIRDLTKLFRQAQAKRSKLAQQIRGAEAKLKGIRAKAPRTKAQARIKALRAARTELTREMKRLNDAVKNRRGPRSELDWMFMMMTGLPGTRQMPAKGIDKNDMPSATNVEVPADGDEEDLFKGYPEFDPDQPRNAGGRWSRGGGGGTSSGRAKKPGTSKPKAPKKPKAPAKPKAPKKPPAKKPAPAKKPKTKPKEEAKPKAPRRRAAKPKPPEQQEATPGRLDPIDVAVETPSSTGTAIVPREPDPEPEPDPMAERDRKRLDSFYERYDAALARVDAIDAEMGGMQDRLDGLYTSLENVSRPDSWRAHSINYDIRDLEGRIEDKRRSRARALDEVNSYRSSITELEARLRGSRKRARKFHKRNATFYGYRQLLNAGEFVRWAKSQGFETTLDPEDLHVTVAYSRDPVDWPEPRQTTLRIKPASGSARGIQRLGEDGKAVVLRFESELLQERWNQFRDMGASWDHEGYKPHVTITYRAPPDADLQDVQPYEGELVFGPEQFEEVQEEPEHVEKMREVARALETSMVEKRAGNNFDWQLLKADESLGLVFGWAIVSTEDGEPYYDTQGDHIPEDAMLNAATEFMLSRRAMKIMHAGKNVGKVVFAWPMTDEVAAAMGIEGKRTGLMIAVKPDNPRVLQRFRDGEYTGFSIGGNRLVDEDVDD